VGWASLNIGLLTDFDMRYTLSALLRGCACRSILVSKVHGAGGPAGCRSGDHGRSAFTIFAVQIFAEASVRDALRASVWGFGNGFLAGI